MTASEAQKRANARYRKKSVKHMSVSFYPKEIELYEHVQTKNNKMGYIKELIRRDLEQENQGK